MSYLDKAKWKKENHYHSPWTPIPMKKNKNKNEEDRFLNENYSQVYNISLIWDKL